MRTGLGKIVRRIGTDQSPVVRLEGCETRTAIEALHGQPLLVDPADAPPLEEGEHWAHEYVGCVVHDGEREVGVVARLVELPSVEALEVGDLLIPLVRDAVRSVDMAGRRIDVDLRFLGAD